MEDNILVSTVRLCRMADEKTKAIDILKKLKELHPEADEETLKKNMGQAYHEFNN